jgi:hypothetical protein
MHSTQVLRQIVQGVSTRVEKHDIVETKTAGKPLELCDIVTRSPEVQSQVGHPGTRLCNGTDNQIHAQAFGHGAVVNQIEAAIVR